MKNVVRGIATVLVASAAFVAAVPAFAHGDRDRYEHRGHRYGHDHRHWQDRHGAHHSHAHGVVVRERIVVERPVAIERRVFVERPVVYLPLEPSIVIGVNLPPLVIPLR
jgi:Ni/Co efflux regulator RcnB